MSFDPENLEQREYYRMICDLENEGTHGNTKSEVIRMVIHDWVVQNFEYVISLGESNLEKKLL